MKDRIFRLARIVAQEVARAGSYAALEEQIARSSAGILHKVAPIKIDRRKLRQIAEADDNVGLKLFQLRALDRYLAHAQPGMSLADVPIFEKLGVLDSLVEGGWVCFVVGSRVNEEQRIHDLRRWDCRAMAVLMHDLGEYRGQIRFEFEDVAHTTPIDCLKSEPWYGFLGGKGPSVVSIGSTRACLGTEVLLARMFGLEPFQKRSEGVQAPPFRFVWSPEVAPSFPSSFNAVSDDLAPQHKKLAREIRTKQAWAIEVESELHRVPRHYRSTDMYGVIAAQRRSEGPVYLVIAGISGPATFAAAKLVSEVQDELPYPDPNMPSGPVLWAIVRVQVSARIRRKGDNREVGKAEFLVHPKLWQQHV